MHKYQVVYGIIFATAVGLAGFAFMHFDREYFHSHAAQTHLSGSDAGALADHKIPETAAIDEPLDVKKPIIAIIIDDVGVDLKRSRRAEKLPPQVTLSYLPYSRKLKEQTDAARADGHELMVHLPMQPERAGIDPGPDYLGTDLAPEEVSRRVEKNLDAFTGYIAVNNHMGSQFTQDRARLMILMAAIKKRDSMFIDSKTAPQSIAEKVAREFGIEANHRDIFIDNSDAKPAIDKQLKLIEQTAAKYGSAIAIGHPRDLTLNALESWLPALEAKGYKLVPITEAVRFRESRSHKIAGQ